MEITWLGHSCFKLKGKNATVVTDPPSPETGYSLGKTSAEIVTVSHQHPGHSFVQGIGGSPKLVNGPGEYEIAGILIIGMTTHHDAEKGASSGKNTIYLIEIDDVTLCHLGDLGHMLNDEQIEELGSVDILLLPVGGITTINATIAAEVVRRLEPKVVIPMHYQTPAFAGELEPVNRFLKEMGNEQVSPQPKISFTKSNLPEPTQIFLLNYPQTP